MAIVDCKEGSFEVKLPIGDETFLLFHLPSFCAPAPSREGRLPPLNHATADNISCDLTYFSNDKNVEES